jgi:Family of unknown function (DUF5317)
MLVLGIAVAVALVLPLFTRGSYTRLVMTDWRWSPLLFAGLGLQLALEFLPIPKSRWDDVGFTMLIASYVLIIGFCARNLLLRGMVIVLIGVACNTLVIGLNHGMPVDIPPDFAQHRLFEPTVKHHPQTGDDRLTFLGDIIVLRAPFDTVISFGDLIIAVGLCDVTFHASRRRRGRRNVSDEADEAVLAMSTANGASAASAAATAVPETIDLTEYVADDAEGARQPAARELSPTARSSALSTRSS